MDKRLLVGISQGDINGIGYEIILKVLGDGRFNEVAPVLLIGSSRVAGYYKRFLESEEEPMNLSFNLVRTPEEIADKRYNVVNYSDEEVRVEPGGATEQSNEHAMLALRQALDYLDNNRIDVLVSAPMCDEAFGHEQATSLITYLSKRYESEFLLPLYVGEHMKMAFLTPGGGIKETLEMLTIQNMVNRLKMLNRALVRDFAADKPRIAVLALNASSGDGKFGEEEESVIKPAIAEARNSGIMAVGPYAADIFFAGRQYMNFDAVLALYNDQGMIPFREAEGFGGALLIAGLPEVLTTTIHGTAFDIVEKGVADDSSLRQAIYLALDVYARREEYKELTSDPLRKYDLGGDKRESELNVEQIAGID